MLGRFNLNRRNCEYHDMKKSHFILLFLSSLIIWTTGNGLLPLLPVYAKSLGANDFMVGAYLAFSYLCLALGVMSSGYIVGPQVSRKRLIIYSGLVCLPLTWLMGWVNSVELLIPITSLLWFLGGIAFSALNTLASDLTAPRSRGAFFSLFAMASPLGAIIGGLISGPVVDQWGYQTLFSLMTLVTLLWPLSICLLEVPLDSVGPVNGVEPVSQAGKNEQSAPLNTNIVWLVLASLAAFTANFMGTLGVSLSMNELGFNATEITSTAVVGGLIALPFIYGIGRLSDLFGRKKFWLICCASGLVALYLLPTAVSLWNYWWVALLLRIFSTGNRGISNAWVVDLSNGLNVPKLIALLGSVTWVGGIVGYLMTGYGLSHWGRDMTFDVALLFSICAIIFVTPIKYSPNENVKVAI